MGVCVCVGEREEVRMGYLCFPFPPLTPTPPFLSSPPLSLPSPSPLLPSPPPSYTHSGREGRGGEGRGEDIGFSFFPPFLPSLSSLLSFLLPLPPSLFTPPLLLSPLLPPLSFPPLHPHTLTHTYVETSSPQPQPDPQPMLNPAVPACLICIY